MLSKASYNRLLRKFGEADHEERVWLMDQLQFLHWWYNQPLEVQAQLQPYLKGEAQAWVRIAEGEQE